MSMFGLWRRFSGAEPQDALFRAREAETPELCARALGGDRPAWSELIRRFDRRLWQHVVYRFHVDDVRADDLCQETWMKLTRKLEAKELSTLKLPGLAYQQAWYLHFGKREDLPESSPDDDAVVDVAPSVLDRLLDEQERVTLRKDIDNELSPRQREVLLLGLQRGCTDAEVAEELGISLNRVRELKKEAYARLRAQRSKKEERP